MKRAAISDLWRNLQKVPRRANGIIRITQLSNSVEISNLETDGLFAVVGANGAGKSSFFSFLTDINYCRLAFNEHKINLADGSEVNIPGQALNAVLIDPYGQLKASNEMLSNLKSTFGQKEQFELPEKVLGLLNYVLGSSYQSIKIEEVDRGEDRTRTEADSAKDEEQEVEAAPEGESEIMEGGEIEELEDEEIETCPRFIFTENGHEYDNFSLSLGEQLVTFTYWLLTKKYRNAGIFFLEEPEAGLSPAAQLRIVDLLAFISTETGKQIFLSTHSPFIVSTLGKSRVIVMKRPQGAVWHKATDNNYLDELGISPPKRGIFFLEDNKAKVFFEKLLDLYGSTLRRSFDMIFLGGESNVFEVINRISNRAQSLQMIGIIDADQKNETRFQTPGYHILPGTMAPEQEVLAAVIADTALYARALCVNAQILTDVMRICRGYQFHDKFEEISNRLFGEVRPQVYEAAFRVWYEKHPNKDEIDQFIRSVDPDISPADILAIREAYK